MTHVFVVNETTFNVHLQYRFAGTGDGEYEPDFSLTNADKYTQENTLTAMNADISKVRDGDKVLFYVTGCKKFFGIFQIEGTPFFESKNTNYLYLDLGKRYLPYRVKIRPFKVYAKGISEEIALDDISAISRPYEMCWSMIYRKLTGLRGCSFITEKEMADIEKLLDKENNSQVLGGNDFFYDSNTNARCIVKAKSSKTYSGTINKPLSIDTRLYNIEKPCEVHLQAYIMQQFDKNQQLKKYLFPRNVANIWIGNEVVCSVGEKRIDVLVISETKTKIQVRVIELKDSHPTNLILTDQFPWYIKWVNQYIIPNLLSKHKHIELVPTIISKPYKRECSHKKEFETGVTVFNKTQQQLITKAKIKDLECIYFDKSMFPIRLF